MKLNDAATSFCRSPRVLVAAWLLVSLISSRAATFSWTKLAAGNASGSWTNQANWSGGTLPTTTADAANFSSLDLTADSTITLDGNQAANSLSFSDVATASAANWIVNAGSPASSTLSLGGSNPTINVPSLGSGSAAVINAVLSGTGGLTKTGVSFLQLNGANTYSGGTLLSGSDCRISVGNNQALGTGTVILGATPGAGQIWFNAAGSRVLTNAFEVRTIRWIIDASTVAGVAAGDLTINGNILLNTGGANVRDIYPNGNNLTLNGNLSVTPPGNPLNKNGGSTLTLNGTNTVGGASSVNAGTLIVNGPMNGGATFTVNAGSTLGGTGLFSGVISLASGGNLSVGAGGSGRTTCGGLISVAGAQFNYGLGATTNPANGFIKVNGNVLLAGILNLSDLGGFSTGTYTGLQYSGSITLAGLAAGIIPGGKSLLVDTNLPGYVLFHILNGALNPVAGQRVPMDLAAPLSLGWLEVPGSTAYDAYLGTGSNAVAVATTNSNGIYQGRTSALTLNIAGLQPNTTYFWRVDGVAANGALTKGAILSFTTGAAMVDLMEDTWVAADTLSRSLPGLAECGSPRTNRPIGLFYYLWHKYAPGFGTANWWDVSQYLAANPFTDPHNPWADNPVMQTAKATYWWGQPELGYYDPSDPWVLRRQIALLAHAGIDVLIFDYSNAVAYDTQLYALCDMIRQMRFEGYPIHLKITFLTHANSGATATYLYNTLYGPGKYPDLWFYWQGKPLILGYVNGSGSGDTVPSPTVQNYFTWRTSWAFVATNALHDEWQWADTPTPQNWGYDARADLPEELPVSCGGWANGNLGKSNSNNSQQDYDRYHLPLGRTSHLGLFFREQMNYGLKYDPQFLFITQWNEWIAGSFGAPAYCYTHLLADCCPVNGYYFVDEYNEEYSRDLEPMKGGHTDNYYFQMVGQNRLRKGVRPVPPASDPRTINLAGDFSDWTNVAPTYYDPPNDTIPRSFPSSVSQVGTYANSSGRNDFTLLKVARDANNLYFLAQCLSNLTSYTGTNWMVLLLDTDQNHTTGWEGYDYAVNLGPRTASTTTLSRNSTLTNGWTWETVRSDLAYRVNGNQLTLAIPRSSLGLGADPIRFDFHWADNFQTNDIADFGVDGDSAPDRRFNYRYVTATNAEVVLLTDDFESGKQSLWAETWTNGSRWTLSSAAPYAGANCAVGTYAAAGQSNLIARVSTLAYGSFRLSFHYKLSGVLNAQNLQLSYLTTNGWVPIRQLSRDEFYPTAQSWAYDEQQNVWLSFTDTRFNTGPDARFFTTNFAFRIDAGALTAAGQSVFIDEVKLTADTDRPAALSPRAWQTCDIGNAGNAGFVATNATSYTVSGSGLDIWNNGDAFRFLYQVRAGDGYLTARVTGLTPTDPWAKAGVMIRESLDAGSRHALMTLSASNGLAFQRRATPLGASDTTTLGASVVPPYWVRLVRSGTSFTGYVSTNSVNWTQAGTTNLSGFNRTSLWGLAVTAHNNTLTNTATFDNVATSQAPAIAGLSNLTLVAGQTLLLTNLATDPDIPAQTLTWALLTAPANATIDPASGLLSWRPTLAQAPSTNSFTLKVTDNGSPSQSATQSFVVTVLRPAPPSITGLAVTNGVFSMLVRGDTGPDYTVEAATNLNPPIVWLPVQTNLAASPPFPFTDLGETNSGGRFFRVQIGP